MILRSYLYKTMFKPVVYGIIGCTFLILIDTLSEIIENIVVRGVPFAQVIELLSYHMVHLLSFTVPMGMMVGSLVAYGAMSNKNEFSALNSLGINLTKILSPIFILSSVTFLLLLFNNQFIAPIAAERQEDVYIRLAYDKPAIGLAERQFVDSIKGYSLYLDSFNSQSSTAGSFILFANESGADFATVVKGNSANWDDGYMNILDAKAFEIDEKGRKKAFVEFGEQKIPLRKNMGSFDFIGIENEDNQMSLLSLILTIFRRRSEGLSTLKYERALHTKLSLSFSPIVLGLLGALLAVGIHKRFRKSDGKLSGIAVLLIYWLWLMSSRAMILENNFPATIMWIPNAIFLFLAFLLFLYKRRL